MTHHAVHPPYWFVSGLAWPEDASSPMAEAVFAMAPLTVARGVLSPHARQLLVCVHAFYEAHRSKLVVLTDVTRWLEAEHGQRWPDRGVDWEVAQDELLRAPILGLHLTVSNFAHTVLCVSGEIVVHEPGKQPWTAPAQQRRDVYQAVLDQLEQDWPPYARRELAAARPGA